MDVAEFTLRLNAETAEATRQLQRDVNTAKAALKQLDTAVSVPSRQTAFAKFVRTPTLSDLGREKKNITTQQYRKGVRVQAFRELGMHAEADKLEGIEKPASTFELIGKGLRAAGIDLSYTKLVELGSVAAGVAASVMAVKFAFDAVSFSIETVVGAGWELGKALFSAVKQALDFTQTSQQAFGMLLDNTELGVTVFDQVRKEAVALGMDVDTTVDSFRKLLAAQFSVGESNELIKVAADLQAVGASATDVKHALLAISQIKMKGKLQAEELTRQLANAGVSSELVYQMLQKRLNLPGKEGRARVMKMQKAGEISDKVAIPAIIDAIKLKTHESFTGQTAQLRASSTIPGMGRQATGMVQNAFIDIAKLIEAPMTAAVGTVFDSFRRLMTSPIMAELKQSIADTFISAAGFIQQYWPQLEPVIIGVAERAVQFFQSASVYISTHGDEIASKISMIADFTWRLGSAMVSVTGWAFKLGDALLSIANFFEQHPILTKLIVGAAAVTLAPFTAGTSLLAGGAALGFFGGDGVPSGPVEGVNNLTKPNYSGNVDSLLEAIDKRKTGINDGSFGQNNSRTIGTINNHLNIQALDLSDPEVAGGKLRDIINREVHRTLEDAG